MSETGNPTRNDNGGVVTPTARLVLTFTAIPWHLQIAGECPSDDMALALLQQAVRYYEARIRMGQVLELQQQIAEQARAAAIAQSVLRGAGRT